MTAQNVGLTGPSPRTTTVTSGQAGGLVVEVTTPAPGGAELVWEIPLTDRELHKAGYHQEDECEPWCPLDHLTQAHYARVDQIEDILDELHRVAHNAPGDRDFAAECLRYPCRRLQLT